MRSWLITVGALLLALVLLRLACAALRGDLAEWRSARAAARRARRARRHGADVVPLHRPVERVGADLRRLHSTFHRGGMRFAKYEGCRLAYDRVLGEAADMAGCPHLLAVLPPGEELDHERQRVEWAARPARPAPAAVRRLTGAPGTAGSGHGSGVLPSTPAARAASA